MIELPTIFCLLYLALIKMNDTNRERKASHTVSALISSGDDGGINMIFTGNADPSEELKHQQYWAESRLKGKDQARNTELSG